VQFLKLNEKDIGIQSEDSKNLFMLGEGVRFHKMGGTGG
jgi:hypothetical protein